MHQYQDLISIFNACFFEEYNTQLVKGGDEPLYVPAGENQPYHAIFFARGFFASALHECSHWLLAGAERRKLEDFGYWYIPDGRTLGEQALFQQAEIKPQAMEWILSQAAGFKFCLSIDNLEGAGGDSIGFKQAVYEQVKIYCERGLPKRAESFRRALCEFYGTAQRLTMEDFVLEGD